MWSGGSPQYMQPFGLGTDCLIRAGYRLQESCCVIWGHIRWLVIKNYNIHKVICNEYWDIVTTQRSGLLLCGLQQPQWSCLLIWGYLFGIFFGGVGVLVSVKRSLLPLNRPRPTSNRRSPLPLKRPLLTSTRGGGFLLIPKCPSEP